MIGNFNTLDVRVPQEIVHYWGWFLAFGVALLLIGVVAIVRSVTATIVSMLFFGWLLALASGIEVVQAIMVGQWAGFFHHLVAAVLFGVTGFLLVTRPVLSAEVATMLMAVFFLVSGLFQFIGSIWVALSMLASRPASMFNQNRSDLGILNRFNLDPSRSSRAIEACRKHKARLVIAKLDRLSRNLAFIATLMAAALCHNVLRHHYRADVMRGSWRVR
jgi:uncharacterized membrane protein HdeD (DUF308 family)